MVAIAQLVERQVVVLDVAGSSPVGHPSPRVVLMMLEIETPPTYAATPDAAVADRSINATLSIGFVK